MLSNVFVEVLAKLLAKCACGPNLGVTLVAGVHGETVVSSIMPWKVPGTSKRTGWGVQGGRG